MLLSMFIDKVEIRNRGFLRQLFKSIRDDLKNEERTNAKHKPVTQSRHFPVLFLSDLHLGSPTCNAEPLLEFLRAAEADTIYLVGDVFDMWVNFDRHWLPIHTDILVELVRKAQTGTRLIYTPGNHDEFFRRAYGQLSENFEIVDEAIYTTSLGERYLVVHGDQADWMFANSAIVSFFASRVEHFFRKLIDLRNFVGKQIGIDPSEIVDRIVYLFNLQFTVSDKHREFLLKLARSRGCQGVISGHFHVPANERNALGHYVNCGDWIDHCSAAFEDEAGRMVVKSFAPRQFVNLQHELKLDYDEAVSFGLLLARQ